MATAPPLVMVVGQAKTIPIQCNLYGGAKPSRFNSNDVLASKVVQGNQTNSVFTSAVAWYTANDPTTGISTQTGYTQGEVEWQPTAAQMALLQPTVSYTLIVTRTLASGGDPDTIARIPLVIQPIALPA